MLNTRTFQIHRPTKGGTNRITVVDTGLIVTGFLQTASPEFAAITEGEFGRTFELFSDDVYADVRNTDRLIEEGSGDRYDVKGVLLHRDGPGRGLQIALTQHIEQ
jgi:hypothetical protein